MRFLITVLCLSYGIASAGTPNKIVSVSLASDEILIDLLPACKKLSSLLAVSTIADQSSSSHITDRVKDIPHRVHSEPEALLKLKPDLVIAAAFNRPELLDLLKKKGIPLLILTKFSSHQDIAENIRLIAKATNCEPQGEDMARSFLAKIARLRTEQAPLKRETAVSWSSDLTVMAEDTLFDDLLNINHLENVAAKAGLKHWPRVTPESLQKWNPDWVVIGCDGEDCQTAETTAAKHAAWKNLEAIKKHRFIRVSPRVLVSTSQFFGVKLNRK